MNTALPPASLIPAAPESLTTMVRRAVFTTRRPLHACCDKAVELWCTCLCATKCPEHSERHHGTHS